MEHQKSIFSFIQKSSRLNTNCEPSTASTCELAGRERVRYFPSKQPGQEAAVVTRNSMDFVEARGTDTPPEKEPRRIFSRKSYAPGEGYEPSFENIMHKFVKTDDCGKPSERGQAVGGSSNFSIESYKLNTMGGLHGQRKCSQDTILNTSFKKNSLIDSEFFLQLEADGIEPETPGLRPFIPRLKRVQDDCSNLQNVSNYCFKGPTKRVKLPEDSEPGTEIEKETCSVSSKFEWLHPSKIRDSNGRRPTDTLYDKTSLYIPADAMKKMSASQKQYWDVKCHYMDVVLFFKVGKFYELYELDAEIGHKELDWKMTISGVGKCRQVGISEAGIDEAVQKLVARGYKVGRMEQLETSDQAKARGANSVVQRKLISVVAPSTTDYNVGLDALHLLAIKEGKSGPGAHSTVFGFAFVDCSALKFWIGSIDDDSSCAALGALLMQVTPKEVIHENGGLSKETQKVVEKFSFTGSTALQLTSVPVRVGFLDASEVKNLIDSNHYFQGSSRSWYLALDNVVHVDLALSALGGLVTQLARMMLDDVLRNGDLLPYQVYRGCLKMDGQTLHNLEIFRNNDDGTSSGTLFKYLDSCITAPGKRLLRDWICHPLKEVDEINNRLNVVEFLMNHSEIIALVAQHIRKLPDLERLLGRVKSSKQSSVSTLLPFLGNKILKQQVKTFGLLIKGLRVGVDLMLTLVSEDRFISLFSKVTSLPALRGANSLDGFLTQFEAAIDSDFPNYQDHVIVESDAETLSLLIELFVERAVDWGEIIHSISCIDVLRSFSITAGFTLSRPLILPQSESSTNGPTLKIKGLWHPYALGESRGVPVPNDLNLGKEEDCCNPRALLLTGPNMGGKSTILRATCLAVVLAQLGCYVPCEACVISVVDTIFTRLGASDRIMTGESTFFVECSETASVLGNATQDSLVILDELGRGTSTFDGYAIAYAVFRHLIEKVNCRLLFATHYHPLTKEFASHPRVSLQHMSCTFESNSGELVFLYRLAPGACPESYGLRVALTAGIPRLVVEAATRAGRAMEEMIRESFRSSEQRAEFSTLHEEWLKGMLNVCSARDVSEEDVLDTLFCLWHELRESYKNHRLLEAGKI